MSELRDLSLLKRDVLAALGDVAAFSDGVGLASLARDIRDTRVPKLDAEGFHWVVLGEFNHGKSTFVNALVGAPVLPVGITPTTATINHLVWAEAPRATVHLADGGQVSIAPGELGDWVTIDGREASRVRYVEIGWPAEILRDRLTLVDTPGVNDLNEQRAEITYGYIPRADACLFLLDGTQVLKQSERLFLEQRILRRSRDKLIFVIGKTDLLTPEEVDEAVRFCRSHLEHIVPDPLIFPLSAKRALAGDVAGSGLRPLTDHLGDFLATERRRVLIDNAVGDGLRTVAYVGQSLGIKRRSLTLALGELEARIARVRQELAARHATLRATHAKIHADSQAIRANVRLDLEEFTGAFVAALPREIERADPTDVRHYLGPFIEQRWKEWAEAEGEKIAGQLERLSEEIIQITNENLREAMAALARELGPVDVRVALDVDTLKYDVSVFALGALGTTIFLFVNSLVGGLLTLAVPILAAVLEERASGRVKQQAKDSAPTIVRKAAETVGPKFDAIVEEVAARLGDFVTTAGEALYRGISEILDRALAERRAQGIDVAERDRVILADLERLHAIEAHLEHLRDCLWGSSTGWPPSSAT